MNNEQAKRVIEAIQECDEFVAREQGRNPELRPVEIEKLLQHYIDHRARLIAMLAA